MQLTTFQQQVRLGFVITLFFVFIVGIISYTSISGLQKDSGLVDHSEQVLSVNNRILYRLVEAENAQRGYLATGSKGQLKLYNESVAKIAPELKQLRKMVADNPDQVNRIDALTSLVNQKLGDLKAVLSVFKTGGSEAVKQQQLIQNGKMYTDLVRSQSQKIRDVEEQLLQVRKTESRHNVQEAYFLFIVGAVIILFLFMLMFGFIKKNFDHQKLVEEDVRKTNTLLQTVSDENKKRNWMLTGSSVVAQVIREEHESAEFAIEKITTRILNELSKYTGAQVGAFYLADEAGGYFKFTCGYAYQSPKGNFAVYKIGEGLIGQVAYDKKALICDNVPDGHVMIDTGLGQSSPKQIILQPLIVQGNLKGIVELGFTGEISDQVKEFLDWMSETIAVEIQSAENKVHARELFEKTQQQAEELESQHEELRTTNDELVRKTKMLQASEEELRVQQEELRQINSELEEKADMLAERNRAVDQAHEAISLKAKELEQTSRYKSEFLANMSHELRTPLNSILILARILSENKLANLSDEQIKYASVIHNAGSDLLTLINDILDLSKIESGKIDLTIEDVLQGDIQCDIELLFKEVANNKKINFNYNVDEGIPARIISDRVRIEQVLKNLLSNAFKFTPENGSVTVDLTLASADIEFGNPVLQNLKTNNEPVLSFSVSDTGIGIPEDKQALIFEAFKQADGSTSRKYGGTGLGLSISRELSNILGGEIKVASVPGKGSTFTLYLPVNHTNSPVPELFPERASIPKLPIAAPTPTPVIKQKENQEKEPVMLIIEDDPMFADILVKYAKDRGFTPLLATEGDKGLEMALKYVPDSIVLDVMLPVMDGWAILKKLKEDPATRDIPVHMMSAGDEKTSKAVSEGAIGFLKKPIAKEKLDEAFDMLGGIGTSVLKKVLIVEDHEIQSDDLKNQLLRKEVKVEQAFNGQDAMKLLEENKDFDCIILDLNLPDISGLDLLDKIKEQDRWSQIPVVINTAMELDQDRLARVMRHTHAMVLKNSKSNERLLDEVNLFMNKVKGSGNSKDFTPRSLQGGAKNTTTLENALKDKCVLVVDDDMRNIFALTSALQAYDLKIEIANNGVEALKKLEEKPDTHLVLMDIMMPEMDGYEAMTEIRKQNRFKKLPIIALTAKAMKEDREKCIEAGANDYISKPVDIDKLLSLMRVWLS